MSKLTKALTAAAGNAAGDPLYVEDVFSTYLYDGNGTSQVIENGIALGDSNYGSSVEVDGVGDYVSRSSGLSGQSDSHTFTLSVWVFNQVSSGYARIFGIKNSSGSNNILYLQIDSNNYLNVMTLTDGVSQIQGIDAGNSPPGYTVPPNQWSNIIISANLATSTWHLSINDSYSSVTPYKPSGLTDNIDFSTSSGSTVGTLYGSYFKGRITQLYLDNTFRDLSQTSVRRTFINSNGTPATGLASLNPVLYLPLDDTNSVGTNLGTGGAYSVSGSPTQLSAGGPYIESGFGKGGMVWTKWRSGYYTSRDHNLWDTERGTTPYLNTNNTAAEKTSYTNAITYNSNGFTLNTQFPSNHNFGGEIFSSWTFRKAKKFFDVVTYTGDGVTGRTVSHNLGSTPGCIIVKNTTTSGFNWMVLHSSVGATGSRIYLNLTDVYGADPSLWNSTNPTSTEFTLGANPNVNSSGDTYVAYLFASDAGGFGDDGSESIIKCGSYTGNGSSSGPTIGLGFEPQFVMIKAATNYTLGNWLMLDTMRGWTANSGNQTGLYANLSDAEIAANSGLSPTATGFQIKDTTPQINGSGNTYIYIAIRRPMKTPESGTEVFSPVAYSGNSTAGRSITSGFPLDAVFTKGRNAAIEPILYSRLQGSAKKLLTYSNAVEASSSTNVITSFDQDGMTVGTDADINNSSYTYVNYFFKRATGFFDVVAYTGDGTSNRSINHNLGVTPEFIIGKIRSGQTDFWGVWQASLGNQGMYLSATNSAGTTLVAEGHTSSIFKVSNGYGINNVSTLPHIAYLFGSVAGVSKVGSYTGTGSNVDVDCGFSAGARFILIKRTDSTGDWYVYDSVRGIVAGNDPYLLLNSTAAEVTSTDYIDPLASGFTVTSSAPAALNASGGSYIFLAIA